MVDGHSDPVEQRQRSTRRIAVIDAGYGDGVRSGQPVRSADGLIGRTLDCCRAAVSARVCSSPTRNSVVPRTTRQRRSPAVLVNGRGDGSCLMFARSTARTITFKVGDIVVASGSGGVFQPRTPVAIASVRLTREGAIARPDGRPGGGCRDHRRAVAADADL